MTDTETFEFLLGCISDAVRSEEQLVKLAITIGLRAGLAMSRVDAMLDEAMNPGCADGDTTR